MKELIHKRYREPWQYRLKDYLRDTVYGKTFCKIFGHKDPLGLRMDDSKMGFGFCTRCYKRIKLSDHNNR